MADFPTQNITIYHKTANGYSRYVVNASFRNTSVLNYDKLGADSNENALIRVFDIDGYNSTWYAQKGDIIVNKEVTDTITGTTPKTQLINSYGKDNVYEITSIDKFIYDGQDLEELNHIKIGAK